VPATVAKREPPSRRPLRNLPDEDMDLRRGRVKILGKGGSSATRRRRRLFAITGPGEEAGYAAFR